MEKRFSDRGALLLGLLVGLGTLGAGMALGTAYRSAHQPPKSVAMWGTAERVVKADRASWELTTQQTGADLKVLYEELKRREEIIRSFLIQKGFEASEIEPSEYSAGPGAGRPHGMSKSFVRVAEGIRLSLSVAVRTSKVDLVEKTHKSTRNCWHAVSWSHPHCRDITSTGWPP